MAHGLDVVAIGVEHERAIVVGVVVRTHARRAVVAAARGDRRAIERIDVRPRLGMKRDVDLRAFEYARADPEIGLSVGAEAGSDA